MANYKISSLDRRHQIIKALIRFAFSHYPIINHLILLVDPMIVHTSISVIIISQFRNKDYALMSLLQNRHANSYIISSLEVISLIVLKIFFFNISEQLSVKCSQVTCQKIGFSITIIFNDIFMKRTRIPNQPSLRHIVSIHKPNFFFLKNSIK